MARTNNSTLKALEVLELVAGEEQGLRLTDVADHTGYPISTARRLLVSLIDRGYVEQDPQSSRYFLGTKILTLQAQGIRHRQVIRIAYPFMRGLQRDLDETVNLGILSDRSVVYVETLVPDTSLAFYAPPGTRMPLHSTAMGKLFLALLPDTALATVLSGLDYKQFTVHTTKDAKSLAATLPEIRSRGYSIDSEEYALGVRCVAAPIYSHAGQPVAAISVTAMTSRLTPDREPHFVAELRSACDKISAAMGFSGG